MSTPPFLVLPTVARAYNLSTDRGSFAVHDAMPTANPARGTALLIPGFTGSKEDFIAILKPLADKGFRVVAYDQRGQFETPGPASAQGWTTDGYARDALAVAAALGDGPVHLVGHSFGGIVARAAALLNPAAFASLVLLCSGPAGFDAPDRVSVLSQVASGLDLVGISTVWTLLRAAEIENGWQPSADPAVDSFTERRFHANDPGSLAAMARILTSEPDRTDELAAICGPGDGQLRVLVAFGEDDDAWTPKLQAETASRLAVTAVSFPKAAHSPPAELPEETANALADFWR